MLAARGGEGIKGLPLQGRPGRPCPGLDSGRGVRKEGDLGGQVKGTCDQAQGRRF